MRGLILAALLAAGIPAVAQAQTAPVLATQPEPAAERFLQMLKTGTVHDALTAIASGSSLLAGKMGDGNALAAQIQVALSSYGPVTGWERIESKTVGTMLRRDTYIVQHREMVTRWRFVFVRAGNGWIPASFAFEDSVPTWFE
jgi:hypothetical protein